MQKVKMNSKKVQNASYKANNRRDVNKLAKLARANAKHPTDAQTAEAYVKAYHKVNG